MWEYHDVLYDGVDDPFVLAAALQDGRDVASACHSTCISEDGSEFGYARTKGKI